MQPGKDIFEELKHRIINLDLQPGSIISEKELMEEFGLSRTPIREALIKLAQIGLVETRARVGTYVTQIDIMAVKNAYEVKKNLEGLAAELAAKRATAGEVAELFEIIDRFDGYDIITDYKLCIEDDQRFHRIVRQASRNDMLIEILDMLNTRTARFLQQIHYVIDDFAWFRGSLREMAEAIKARDVEKARACTEDHTANYLEQMSRRFFGS